MPVTPTSLAGCEIRTVLPATIEAVDAFSLDFRRCCQALAGGSAAFAAELLVREALTNAVVHGCGRDPRKRIECTLRLSGRRMSLAVRDEGEGFNWRAARSRSCETLAPSGRGIEILQLYASHLRFNEKGNCLTIGKRFS